MASAAGRLAEVGELVDPGDRGAAVRDIGRPTRAHLFDLRGDVVARRGEAPRASMSWKCDQAWAASLSVRSSTNHEPPAGSSTRPMCDSSSSNWVLRAMRRENAG